MVSSKYAASLSFVLKKLFLASLWPLSQQWVIILEILSKFLQNIHEESDLLTTFVLNDYLIKATEQA